MYAGRTIKHGATDQSVVVRILDSTGSTPETGVTSATPGLSLQYRRGAGALATITPTDLSALTDAHADGGLLHVRDGYYRVDVPDAAWVSGAGDVEVFVAATDMVGQAAYHPLGAQAADVESWDGSPVPAPDVAGYPRVDVQYVEGTTLSPVTQAGGNGTATLVLAVTEPATDDALNGRRVRFPATNQEGTISDYAGSTRIATFVPPLSPAVSTLGSVRYDLLEKTDPGPIYWAG